MSESVIHQLATRNVEDFVTRYLLPVPKECPICKSLFSGGSESPNTGARVPSSTADTLDAVRISTCAHIFCRTCIEKWVRSGQRNANTCPICRIVLYDRPSLSDDEETEEEEVSADGEETESELFDDERYNGLIRDLEALYGPASQWLEDSESSDEAEVLAYLSSDDSDSSTSKPPPTRPVPAPEDVVEEDFEDDVEEMVDEWAVKNGRLVRQRDGPVEPRVGYVVRSVARAAEARKRAPEAVVSERLEDVAENGVGSVQCGERPHRPMPSVNQLEKERSRRAEVRESWWDSD